MSCRSTLALLGDFVEGAISADADALVRAHLSDCPRCVEFLASYRATGRILAEATDVDVPAEVEARLRARLGISS
jgi:anti-sigma factor RsiW